MQEFDSSITEAALLTSRQCHKTQLCLNLPGKIRVGNGFIRFNKDETRWLGVCMDVNFTFRKYHDRCMKKSRAAEA